MAQFIILVIMSLSLLTAVLSLRSLVIEWRKTQRQAYGTMNFDGRASRGSPRISVFTNAVICLVSLVLLASSMMIYQFIHFPVL